MGCANRCNASRLSPVNARLRPLRIQPTTLRPEVKRQPVPLAHIECPIPGLVAALPSTTSRRQATVPPTLCQSARASPPPAAKSPSPLPSVHTVDSIPTDKARHPIPDQPIPSFFATCSRRAVVGPDSIARFALVRSTAQTSSSSAPSIGDRRRFAALPDVPIHRHFRAIASIFGRPGVTGPARTSQKALARLANSSHIVRATSASVT